MKNRTKTGLKDTFRIALSLVTLLVFPACQKIIDVDLNEAAPRIVIEGLISDRRGPFTITVSKSGSYFNQPVLPAVTGAEVTISDNINITDTLRETFPGIYMTSKIRGIPGRTYTLKVSSDNLEYTGSSTMPGHVNIDSLTLVKSQSRDFGFGSDSENETYIEIHCFFKDPAEKNYYRIKVIKNDSINTENYRLFDDQYTNGLKTELRVAFTNSGGAYRIELMSLDQQTFRYYRTLSDLLYANPFFGSTPVNPDSNLSNGALGYFGTCAVSSKTIFIPDSLFKTVK